MSATPVVVVEAKPETAAPAWHTIVVLAVFLGTSVVSARMQGLERINIPGLSERLSSYLTVIAEEWLVVAFVWWALRQRGISVKELIVGARKSWTGVLEDLAFAFVFLVGWFAVAAALSVLLKLGPSGGARGIIPQTGAEAVAFLLLASTAGFCEELIFRGYLQRQFRLWTGSLAAGIVIQGVVFGLSHGYHAFRIMGLIALEGCALGLMARFRGSLRTVMIAHAIQDSLAILLFFLGMNQ